MGLSVKVYNDVKLASNDNYDFQCYIIDNSWGYKIKNLIRDAFYKGKIIFRGVSYSYSTHNRFREQLIILIGREDLLDGGRINWEILPKNIPFIDLIDFADNEGCLDWEVSSKIYDDFLKYESASSSLPPYYLNHYQIWMETFKVAKENGVVVFR